MFHYAPLPAPVEHVAEVANLTVIMAAEHINRLAY
jgi:hypothetical protein